MIWFTGFCASWAFSFAPGAWPAVGGLWAAGVIVLAALQRRVPTMVLAALALFVVFIVTVIEMFGAITGTGVRDDLLRDHAARRRGRLAAMGRRRADHFKQLNSADSHVERGAVAAVYPHLAATPCLLRSREHTSRQRGPNSSDARESCGRVDGVDVDVAALQVPVFG